MPEILQMMKRTIFAESAPLSPIHVRIFLDTVLKASTSQDSQIELKVFNVSLTKEPTIYNYDADSSESETDDERPNKHKTYFCKQKIVHPELIKYLVEILEVLTMENLQKFETTIESILGKLTTFCHDEVGSLMILTLLKLLNS